MKKTCLWCGGNYFEGFECPVCAEEEYPDFANHDLVDFDIEDVLDEIDQYNDDLLKDLEDDIIFEPDHYSRWPIEPITFIMRNGFEFWRGNIVKYASRAGYKVYDGKDQMESEITDLQKVIRYAEMRINQINGETKL